MFKPFTCGECGNRVTLRTGKGRTREFARGFPVPIPDDFALPTCVSCGETYHLPEIDRKLDPICRAETCKAQALHYRRLVDLLMERHGITQRAIVRACGITPSHLSHILGGEQIASTTLTHLLEAFMACEQEFQRHLDGRALRLPRKA